jgi:hypothetical protein
VITMMRPCGRTQRWHELNRPSNPIYNHQFEPPANFDPESKIPNDASMRETMERVYRDGRGKARIKNEHW